MGQIITFYSFKGGTGRTMALANVACHLAQSGQRVLCVDWDLEAPGLHHFFAKLMPPEATRRAGLVDVMTRLQSTVLSSPGLSEDHLPGLVSEALEGCTIATDIASLDLVTAGILDEGYPSRVVGMQWKRMHTSFPSLIQLVGEHWSTAYDYVLIDSRTGVSDTSGICTALLPEKVVTIFTPNRQSLLGGLEVAALATRYRRQSADLRPLILFPVPSRVEIIAEKQLHHQWRFEDPGYQPLWEQSFEQLYDLVSCDLQSYFDEVTIPYMPRYAYGEDIAVLTERDAFRSPLANGYTMLTEWLAGKEAPWHTRQITASAR